jgi:hypothetical protein
MGTAYRDGRISVRAPRELVEAVARAAALEGISPAEAIRRCAETYAALVASSQNDDGADHLERVGAVENVDSHGP